MIVIAFSVYGLDEALAAVKSNALSMELIMTRGNKPINSDANVRMIAAPVMPKDQPSLPLLRKRLAKMSDAMLMMAAAVNITGRLANKSDADTVHAIKPKRSTA